MDWQVMVGHSPVTSGPPVRITALPGCGLTAGRAVSKNSGIKHQTAEDVLVCSVHPAIRITGIITGRCSAASSRPTHEPPGHRPAPARVEADTQIATRKHFTEGPKQ